MNGRLPRAAAAPEIEQIDAPYLLALLTVSVYEHGGRRYLDDLWAKDLRRHAEYITDLTLVCYREPIQQLAGNLIDIDDCALLGSVKYVCVSKPRNTLHGIGLLPTTMCRLWQAARNASVLHSGIAGWPMPSSWLMLPIQAVRKAVSLIIVESAPWRAARNSPSMLHRARSAVTEQFNRICVSRATIAIFTHDGYRQSLLGKKADRGLVIPASWIDEEDIVQQDRLQALVKARKSGERLRLVFVGRLAEEKGIKWLVQSLLQRGPADTAIELDIFGAGPLDEWIRSSLVDRPDLTIRAAGTVAYGAEFLSTVAGYDALVLPTLTDEQPRILFDAYSQGLPVIASSTEGVRDYIGEGVQGALHAPGDVQQLYAAIDRFAAARDAWAAFAQACVEAAQRMTHREMHRERALVIQRALAQWKRNARGSSASP
jgi:glycosyltransferase involved in cell wall biosynthesis